MKGRTSKEQAHFLHILVSTDRVPETETATTLMRGGGCLHLSLLRQRIAVLNYRVHARNVPNRGPFMLFAFSSAASAASVNPMS
jgi:hypothetical protein